VRSIVSQQLAGRAATAMFARLLTAVGGTIEAGSLQAVSDEHLRAVDARQGRHSARSGRQGA
jgi:3-methyladenine DNA glycosylase/8-oxoguanine DNA glycosylase